MSARADGLVGLPLGVILTQLMSPTGVFQGSRYQLLVLGLLFSFPLVIHRKVSQLDSHNHQILLPRSDDKIIDYVTSICFYLESGIHCILCFHLSHVRYSLVHLDRNSVLWFGLFDAYFYIRDNEP
jgi:hypothetical protein